MNLSDKATKAMVDTLAACGGDGKCVARQYSNVKFTGGTDKQNKRAQRIWSNALKDTANLTSFLYKVAAGESSCLQAVQIVGQDFYTTSATGYTGVKPRCFSGPGFG